jgi:hypothetical protein
MVFFRHVKDNWYFPSKLIKKVAEWLVCELRSCKYFYVSELSQYFMQNSEVRPVFHITIPADSPGNTLATLFASWNACHLRSVGELKYLKLDLIARDVDLVDSCIL